MVQSFSVFEGMKKVSLEIDDKFNSKKYYKNILLKLFLYKYYIIQIL